MTELIVRIKETHVKGTVVSSGRGSLVQGCPFTTGKGGCVITTSLQSQAATAISMACDRAQTFWVLVPDLQTQDWLRLISPGRSNDSSIHLHALPDTANIWAKSGTLTIWWSYEVISWTLGFMPLNIPLFNSSSFVCCYTVNCFSFGEIYNNKSRNTQKKQKDKSLAIDSNL